MSDASSMFLKPNSKTPTPRNIPEALHIENIPKAVGDADITKLKQFGHELLSKYRVMEMEVDSILRGENERSNEFEGLCDTIEFIRQTNEKAKKDIDGEPLSSENLIVDFLLSPGIYAKAIVPPCNRVGIWLGGDIMLEYSLDEALTVVSNNKENHIQRIKNLEIEAEWIRKQRVITEVNLSRIHNLGVIKNKKIALNIDTK